MRLIKFDYLQILATEINNTAAKNSIFILFNACLLVCAKPGAGHSLATGNFSFLNSSYIGLSRQ